MDSVGSSHRLTNEAHLANKMTLDEILLKKDRRDERIDVQNLFSKQGNMSANVCESSYSEMNEVSISMGNLNVNKEQGLESKNIADQLRQQKEEFWESLIRRGFMKPRDVTIEGAEAAKEVIFKILQNKAHADSVIVEDVSARKKVIINENEPRVQEENKTTSKIRASITNAKRNQTLNKAQVSQEAQVGVSLLSSYSSSFQSATTEDSQSLKPSLGISTSERSSQSGVVVTNDCAENSNDTYDTSHQSSNQSRSSESESFPSYDGVSNGE